MKINWKKTAAAVVITSSLVMPGYSVFASNAQPISTQVGTYHPLSDVLQVELKSLLNERTSDGINVGVVVRMKNDSDKVTRVPEYEVRVKTDAGIEYTLKPSASNAKAVQPQSKVELSYMLTVDRQDEITITELSWVDVDYYVYPKAETPILTLNVAGQAWKGSNTVIEDQAAVKKWGESFQLQSANSPLIFTPMSISIENTETSKSAVVKVLVENNSEYRENIPEFSLDGRDETDVFKGTRVEQGPLALEAGDKRYIHYSIPTDQDTVIQSLNVVTPESFVDTGFNGDIASIQYTVGRYNILLPNFNLAEFERAVAYQFNDTIEFDSVSEAVNPDVKVSLVELSMHDSEGVGYQTAVAKFKLTNTSSTPIPLPNIQAEIQSSDGYSYTGYRQSQVPLNLMPNLSHVISYSFIVPDSETGEDIVLKLQEPVTSATVKSTIASLKVDVQQPVTNSRDVLSFYPYSVKVNNWIVQEIYNPPGTGSPFSTHSYKLKMDMDITSDDKVVVDQNISKFKVAIVDREGRILGEEDLSFVNNTEAARKLVSGEAIINFYNVRTEQFESDISIQIFEAFDTPNGEAKRLVAKFGRTNTFANDLPDTDSEADEEAQEGPAQE